MLHSSVQWTSEFLHLPTSVSFSLSHSYCLFHKSPLGLLPPFTGPSPRFESISIFHKDQDSVLSFMARITTFFWEVPLIFTKHRNPALCQPSPIQMRGEVFSKYTIKSTGCFIFLFPVPD